MALSNVELYEALKGPVGPEAARMIAEVFPTAQDAATRSDLAVTKSDLEARMAQIETRVVDRIAQLESQINARLWVMFIPLWVGLYGLIATLLVRG